MNIVAYCRVSTDKDDQINSLETQKRFFALYVVKYLKNISALQVIFGALIISIRARKQSS